MEFSSNEASLCVSTLGFVGGNLGEGIGSTSTVKELWHAGALNVGINHTNSHE